MKIATLTLNPALDRTMYFGDDVKIGVLNRAKTDRESVTTIGAKGTNVSCMFKILGIETTAYGFVGGDNGAAFVRGLQEYNITTDFTQTVCNTRMNIKIITDNGSATEFNESGGIISDAEKLDLMNKIERSLSGTDLFFMGGSVPVGVEKSIYRDMINLSGNTNTKFIVDCDGEALKQCMNNDKKPFIIKPNQFELEQYCGKKFNLDEDFDNALEQVKAEVKKIYDETGVIILCTLGEYGGLYCGEAGIFYKKSPKVEVRGFTGAGDTFLTAFCSVYFNLYEYRDNGVEAALELAIAASSAKVTKRGTEFPTVDEIRNFIC